MFACNVFPRQTFPPLFLGLVSMCVALGLLSKALEDGKDAFIFGMMGLSGFGVGLTLMPAPLHAIARRPNQLAIVVGLLQFCPPFGGPVALAIMGCVMNNRL